MLLEKMKKGVGKVVITILAVLLIISFAVWGIGDMVTPGGNINQVAEVDGTAITQREFQDQFQREMNVSVPVSEISTPSRPVTSGSRIPP